MRAAASRRSFVGDTLCSRSSAVSASAYVTPLALNGPAFSPAPASRGVQPSVRRDHSAQVLAQALHPAVRRRRRVVQRAVAERRQQQRRRGNLFPGRASAPLDDPMLQVRLLARLFDGPRPARSVAFTDSQNRPWRSSFANSGS